MSRTKKITSIEIQAKRKDRFSIFLDGEFAFGIHQEILLKSGIARGDELDEKQIEQILSIEDEKKAKDKAFRLLAVRARSKKEIITRLAQAGFSERVISTVVEDLESHKFINDAEFATMFARSRMITRPVGVFVLRLELQQKGLTEEDIENGIEAAYKDIDEKSVAWELAKKRKKVVRKLEETKAKKRVSDFLLRRGFGWDIVKDIMEHWEQIDSFGSE